MMERLEAHPLSPAAKFAKYREAIRAHALRTPDERAATDRKEHSDTEYNRVGLHNEEQT